MIDRPWAVKLSGGPRQTVTSHRPFATSRVCLTSCYGLDNDSRRRINGKIKIPSRDTATVVAAKCIVRELDIRACRCRLFDASWLTRRFAWHHRVKEPRRPLHDSVRRVTERQTHERNVGSGFSGSHQLGKTPPRPLPALAFHSLGHPDVRDRGLAVRGALAASNGGDRWSSSVLARCCSSARALQAEMLSRPIGTARSSISVTTDEI
jgi:hypothetical protein